MRHQCFVSASRVGGLSCFVACVWWQRCMSVGAAITGHCWVVGVVALLRILAVLLGQVPEALIPDQRALGAVRWFFLLHLCTLPALVSLRRGG
jgi:hypothetical protein